MEDGHHATPNDPPALVIRQDDEVDGVDPDSVLASEQTLTEGELGMAAEDLVPHEPRSPWGRWPQDTSSCC
jgi:hypothetical protein